MKVAVVTTITIKATASEVYKYLTDLKYAYLWNPQIKELSSQHVLKLNSTYKTTSQVLGITIQSENVVTKYLPGEELQIENITGMVQYVANFKLVPSDDHTVTVICTTTVSSANKAFAFTTPVLKLLAKRELQSDLQGLKIAVENHLKGSD